MEETQSKTPKTHYVHLFGPPHCGMTELGGAIARQFAGDSVTNVNYKKLLAAHRGIETPAMARKTVAMAPEIANAIEANEALDALETAVIRPSSWSVIITSGFMISSEHVAAAIEKGFLGENSTCIELLAPRRFCRERSGSTDRRIFNVQMESYDGSRMQVMNNLKETSTAVTTIHVNGDLLGSVLTQLIKLLKIRIAVTQSTARRPPAPGLFKHLRRVRRAYMGGSLSRRELN